MKVHVLVENTCVSGTLPFEHGLSLYLETGDRRILFDMGQGELFLTNAQHMGIDISKVDLAVLSHGHYDHGGGIAAFLKANDHAPVYVQECAFHRYYHVSADETRYIGLDPSLKDNERIHCLQGDSILDQELRLFITPQDPDRDLSANSVLKEETGDGMIQDQFQHEQNLVVTCEGKTHLFSGCAHSGILSIIARCQELTGVVPDTVAGGFHLCMYDTVTNPALVEDMANAMLRIPGRYYTGHCTGLAGYDALKQRMGDKIARLSVGESFCM